MQIMDMIPVICLILLFFGHVDGLSYEIDIYEGSNCTLSDGRLGICKRLPECSIKLKEVMEGLRYSNAVDRCGFFNFTEIVCCPLETLKHWNTRPAHIACVRYKNEVGSKDANDGNNVASGPRRWGILVGVNVRFGEFPYMAALGYRDTDEKNVEVIKYLCGGTLISLQHVLTAAHCVSNIQSRLPVLVRLGNDDLGTVIPDPLEIPISKIIVHPEYNLSTYYHDIAILKLEKKVYRSFLVQPICIQMKSLTEMNLSKNDTLTVTGWGATSVYGDGSTKLLKAEELRFVGNDECSKAYTDHRSIPRGLDNHMICAIDKNITRGADTCQGDSGGPLLIKSENNLTLVGVTSFGQSCGGPSPGVYISVHSYLDWIEDTVWSNNTDVV